MFKDFIFSLVPLLLISTGAIYSKKAGTLAIFLEGAITFGAFIGFSCMYFFDSFFIAFFASIIIPGVFFFFFEKLNKKLNTNIFISGLAINIIISGFVSILTQIFFNKTGTLYFSQKPTGSFSFLIILSIIAFTFLFFTELFLFHSKRGLALKYCDGGKDFLDSTDYNRSNLTALSWGIAGACAGLAGLFLSVRLGSFSLNISSGKSWIALALIFLANDKPVITFIWTTILIITEFILQWIISNFSEAAQIQTFLQAIPFIAVLFFSTIVYIKKIISQNK